MTGWPAHQVGQDKKCWPTGGPLKELNDKNNSR